MYSKIMHFFVGKDGGRQGLERECSGVHIQDSVIIRETYHSREELDYSNL